MEVDEETALLEKINEAVRSENWKEETAKAIKPYMRLFEISKTLELLIEKNRLFEAKKYTEIQLENVKGITEQKCKLKRLKKDYCNFCKNYLCNLNKNVSKNN